MVYLYSRYFNNFYNLYIKIKKLNDFYNSIYKLNNSMLNNKSNMIHYSFKYSHKLDKN